MNSFLVMCNWIDLSPDFEIRTVLFSCLSGPGTVLNTNNITTVDFVISNNGMVIDEEHRFNGAMHRTSGPAYRNWLSDGKLRLEVFWVNGHMLKRRYIKRKRRKQCLIIEKS